MVRWVFCQYTHTQKVSPIKETSATSESNQQKVVEKCVLDPAEVQLSLRGEHLAAKVNVFVGSVVKN